MNKIKQQEKRKIRIRSKIKKNLKPRLSVFRSNRFIYAQIIDDKAGKTLMAAKGADPKEVGLAIAKKAVEKKIKTVVFDRGSYSFHGQVKALAEAAREGGLKF